MNTASRGKCRVQSWLSGFQGDEAVATLMAQLEWMLYGGDLHDSGPMRENKLDSLYRSAPLRSPDRQ